MGRVLWLCRFALADIANHEAGAALNIVEEVDKDGDSLLGAEELQHMLDASSDDKGENEEEQDGEENGEEEQDDEEKDAVVLLESLFSDDNEDEEEMMADEGGQERGLAGKGGLKKKL